MFCVSALHKKLTIMTHTENEIVPQQQEGTKKDIDHSITAQSDEEAVELFNIARNRLVDVNHWHELCGITSANFTLTDASGKEVNRTAEEGDHFKINLPAPGSNEGEGYDWVQIESIENKGTANDPAEYIAIKVRPTANPQTPSDEVAHFFKEDSTSSFVVMRDGKTITAAVLGRNEKPNTETDNIIDKVRNAVVGVTAILGFSNVQWNSLVKGLLDMKK
jgi:hypothetical protein